MIPVPGSRRVRFPWALGTGECEIIENDARKVSVVCSESEPNPAQPVIQRRTHTKGAEDLDGLNF